MSDARGSPCTHKSSVHWQQNESKGWFSGECGFQDHFICKRNFFYWALSDAILDISINCCDWGCWVTGDSVPWLPDSNPASSIVILPTTGKKKIIWEITQGTPFLVGVDFMTQGIKLDQKLTLNDNAGCKAKSPRSWPKRLLGIPSWEPNFCPKKNAEIGDCKTSKAFSVFFCAIFFQHQKFQQSCQQNGAKNLQLLKSSETSFQYSAETKFLSF